MRILPGEINCTHGCSTSSCSQQRLSSTWRCMLICSFRAGELEALYKSSWHMCTLAGVSEVEDDSVRHLTLSRRRSHQGHEDERVYKHLEAGVSEGRGVKRLVGKRVARALMALHGREQDMTACDNHACARRRGLTSARGGGGSSKIDPRIWLLVDTAEVQGGISAVISMIDDVRQHAGVCGARIGEEGVARSCNNSSVFTRGKCRVKNSRRRKKSFASYPSEFDCVFGCVRRLSSHIMHYQASDALTLLNKGHAADCCV